MIVDHLELAIRATAILALAWCAVGLSHRLGAWNASIRHAVWLAAMLTLLILPIAYSLLPSLDLLPSFFPSDSTDDSATAHAGPVHSGSLQGWWTVVYWIGAGLGLARMLWGQVLLWRMWRFAGQSSATCRSLLENLRGEFGLRSGIQTRVSSHKVCPMTWASRSPKILLPESSKDWDESRLRVVLLHELAHIRHRHSLSRLVAALACSLYWPHPAVWLTARRLRRDQEHAADGAVLDAGIPPEVYCRELLALSTEGDDAFARLPASAMARTSALEDRFVSILAQRDRHPLKRTVAITLIAVTGVLTWLAAALTTVREDVGRSARAAVPAPAVPARPNAPLVPRPTRFNSATMPVKAVTEAVAPMRAPNPPRAAFRHAILRAPTLKSRTRPTRPPLQKAVRIAMRPLEPPS